MESSPAQAWSTALAEWGIPDHILAQAPVSPWSHSVAMFASHQHDPDDTPSMHAASALVDEVDGGAVILDVGCGGGRSSMPLADRLERVVGVDQLPQMLEAFESAATSRGLTCSTFLGRWPDVAGDVPVADVVVCHHVVYNVADIVPFVDELERHARIGVVVELTARHPQHALNHLWRHFWGIERPDEPSSDLFVEVLRSTGRQPIAVHWQRPDRAAPLPEDDLLAHVRRRLCLSADRDDELRAALGPAPRLAPDSVATVWWHC